MSQRPLYRCTQVPISECELSYVNSFSVTFTWSEPPQQCYFCPSFNKCIAGEVSALMPPGYLGACMYDSDGNECPGALYDRLCGRDFAKPAGCGAVGPSPATHSIWTVLKAGETVYQADKLPKAL